MRHDRITVDPGVMFGKPCIKGTRIPVEQILRELGGGMTPDDLFDAHPKLTPADVNAAIIYAADIMRQVWTMTQPTLLGEFGDAVSG